MKPSYIITIGIDLNVEVCLRNWIMASDHLFREKAKNWLDGFRELTRKEIRVFLLFVHLVVLFRSGTLRSPILSLLRIWQLHFVVIDDGEGKILVIYFNWGMVPRLEMSTG